MYLVKHCYKGLFRFAVCISERTVIKSYDNYVQLSARGSNCSCRWLCVYVKKPEHFFLFSFVVQGGVAGNINAAL